MPYNESKPSGVEVDTEAEGIPCILKRHINIQNVQMHHNCYKNLLLDNVLINIDTHTASFCDDKTLVMNGTKLLLGVN